MEQAAAPIAIGFVTYGALTAPYLSSFISSLRAQTAGSCRLIAFDNTPALRNPNAECISQQKDIEFMRSPKDNIGFSGAYNAMIRRAIEGGAKYFLVINPDTVLNADVVALLTSELEADDRLGSVAPKLLRWDFKNRRQTDLIDSCGIVMRGGLRFIDLGQGETDRGQHDSASIIGPSGAAGLFRLSALAAVSEAGSYFDEHFPLYKEDCDLVYRLHLAGFASRLISRAVVYHDRTASGGSILKRFVNRRQRSRESIRSSFIGDHLIWIKYWNRLTISGKLAVALRAAVRFVAAWFEPYTLLAYADIKRRARTLIRY